MSATLVVYDELPSTLNPLYARTAADVRAQELLFERIFTRSPIASTPTSPLVRGYEWHDGVLRLEMERGKRWADGVPVTATDVCFTVAAILDPANDVRWAEPHRRHIAGCDVVGNDAWVRYRGPDASPWDWLDVTLLPAHAFEAGTLVSVDHPFSRDAFGTRGRVGRIDGQRVIVEASGKGHRPAIRRVELHAQPLIKDAVDDLLAGRVHGIVDVPPDARGALTGRDDIALVAYPLSSVWFIAVDARQGPLADAEVRRALDLALDREALMGVSGATGATDPRLERVVAPYATSSPACDRSLPLPREDDALARTLLAGRAEPLAVTVGIGTSDRRASPGLAEAVAAELEELGIVVTVHAVDGDPLVDAGTSIAGVDLLIGSWTRQPADDVAALLGTGGRSNRLGWSDSETDRLLHAIDAAATETARHEAQRALHRHVAEVRPVLSLWSRDTTTAWRSEVGGTLVSPVQFWSELDRWSLDAKHAASLAPFLDALDDPAYVGAFEPGPALRCTRPQSNRGFWLTRAGEHGLQVHAPAFPGHWMTGAATCGAATGDVVTCDVMGISYDRDHVLLMPPPVRAMQAAGSIRERQDPGPGSPAVDTTVDCAVVEIPAASAPPP